MRRRTKGTNVVQFPQHLESVESMLPALEAVPSDDRLTVARNALRLFLERGEFNPNPAIGFRAQHACLISAGVLFLLIAEEAATSHAGPGLGRVRS